MLRSFEQGLSTESHSQSIAVGNEVFSEVNDPIEGVNNDKGICFNERCMQCPL